MPSRVIREGLLDSQRYWSVSIESRQLFIHLLLLADDFGLVSLAPVFLRRRCFDNPPPDAKIGKQLAELQDEDLVRVYEDGRGARYGFLPRFGQRLRMMRCKHPMPPEALFADDFDAKTKFSENRHLLEKLSATRRRVADSLRPEVELKGKEKEVEVKTGQVKSAQQQSASSKSADDWAKEFGIVQQPGEHRGAFHARVSAALEKLKHDRAGRRSEFAQSC